MYFGTHHYPWVRGLTWRQKDAALNAVYRKAHWAGIRFLAAVILVVAAGFLVGRYADPSPLKRYSSIIVGVAFLLYLLWEINGPLLRIARQHFAEIDAGGPNSDKSTLDDGPANDA
jgi:hypothetical protein